MSKYNIGDKVLLNQNDRAGIGEPYCRMVFTINSINVFGSYRVFCETLSFFLTIRDNNIEMRVL